MARALLDGLESLSEKQSQNTEGNMYYNENYTSEHNSAASKPLISLGLTCIILFGASSQVNADEEYFQKNVVPQLGQCAACHVANFIRPRVFEYRELLPFLAMGTGPDKNVLIAKMTNARHLLPNVASHPGGQRCASIDSEPCLTFRKWWGEEFKDQQ